ncbi:MAG: dihydrodipicolinate synthase family protein [Verrucomicrobiota bacterium]
MITSEKLFSQPLRGIVPPMITPLCGRDTLDVAGLERLIEHIFAGGVHGLFILGTSGEAPSLSYRLRRELITRVCAQVKGRVPVLVGITDTSFVESVSLARHSAEAGAQAVVTSAPYYFPAGQPELLEYIEHLVPELPLPLFLYNMPQMTKVMFEPETIRRVMHLERIVGIKDSSGDMEYFKKLMPFTRQRPDWTVLIGPEHLLVQSMRCGGHGGVNGGANIWPQLYVKLFEAASRGDAQTLALLEPKLTKLGEVYCVGRHASAVVKGMKCAASLLGLCDDFMAEPFVRFHEPERAKVRAVLQQLNLKVT